ncbi:hypothetical protein [Cryptosporangium phraense]|uniref:Uncharacterized protein n=1 Tax=Cryptosporangium phraense TaxID=2593070 RepID=A0A545AXF3_9ACTN|nr:hypothetical protein [Cryptosporangium phraense]TQS45275.1 hypothetical protein FL583_09245 [Cryptosporangium phraense]
MPWLAIVGTMALVAGLVLQASWDGAFAALADDPAKVGWWRPFTAVFLQNGGFVGVAFNLVTAAIVLALAGALLLTPTTTRRRLLALAVPLAGLTLWFVQANGHGLVSAEGFVLGAAIAAAGALLRRAPAPERSLT